jgi:hypothetical protein
MHAFNQSLKYDQRMHDADIRGSIAYSKALTKVGILTKEEEEKMIAGLKLVGKEWADGTVRHSSISFQVVTLIISCSVCSCTGRRGYSYRQRTKAW